MRKVAAKRLPDSRRGKMIPLGCNMYVVLKVQNLNGSHLVIVFLLLFPYGVERLQILYETFNPDTMTEFQFDYGSMIRTGLNTKDYVAPTSFVFKDRNIFRMGNTIGAVSYLQILAPELTDKKLAEWPMKTDVQEYDDHWLLCKYVKISVKRTYDLVGREKGHYHKD